RLLGGPDGEPAVVAHLLERRILSHLEAELLRVEGLRLVLVVDPDAHVGNRTDHLFCSSRFGSGWRDRSYPADSELSSRNAPGSRAQAFTTDNGMWSSAEGEAVARR